MADQHPPKPTAAPAIPVELPIGVTVVFLLFALEVAAAPSWEMPRDQWFLIPAAAVVSGLAAVAVVLWRRCCGGTEQAGS